jgi:hypothetical protein
LSFSRNSDAYLLTLNPYLNANSKLYNSVYSPLFPQKACRDISSFLSKVRFLCKISVVFSSIDYLLILKIYSSFISSKRIRRYERLLSWTLTTGIHHFPLLECPFAWFLSTSGTVVQAVRSRVRFPMSSLDLSIVLILPGRLGLCGLLSL